MLRLAGELADGVCLSWCTPAQVEVVRAAVSEGARQAGRAPGNVKVASYVRVSVDDDAEAARRALARSMLNYAIGWPGASGPQVYRSHFERMGFADEVEELAGRRAAGASESELIEAFPSRLLDELGYYGPAAGAAAAFRRLAGSADVAILRLVPSRPDAASIRDILDSCNPARLSA
jgi:alkanesulfonate monooxygenase SsuD/methylene tetrahydromethanopterin reductase-like flavin-dependent oxidoreductase (luciferase family)